MVMVELQQPRHLVHRVDGHDLHVLVDHPYVYLSAEDVEAIAGVPAWATGESLLLDEGQTVDLDGVTFYPLDEAVARAREESLTPERAARFLAWIEEHLPLILDPELLEHAHRVPSVTQSYTVAAAAEILDRDPAISMGRARLFEHMAFLGWIERRVGDWAVTPLAHGRDWLVSRPVIVRGRRYRQIHVTRAGLIELRRSLVASPAVSAIPASPAQPALFDIPTPTRDHQRRIS